MGSFSIWHWLIVAFFAVFVIFPIAKILRKAGYSGWWSLLYFIPLVNLICIWIFAFAPWPVSRVENDRR